MKPTKLSPPFSIATPHGDFKAYFSRVGLARLDFPDEPVASVELVDGGPANEVMEEWGRLAGCALLAALEGRSTQEGPPLDLSQGTDLERMVWAFLQRIPAGATRSYSEVAKAIGRPQAARAIGRACGANPIPVLVPCHRVVTAGGRLGGYSGGLHWKRWLLDRERQVAPIFCSPPVGSRG